MTTTNKQIISLQKLNKIIDTTKKNVDAYTYPVFTNTRKKPDLIASCIILEVETKHYLVTASHVVNDFYNGNHSFHIGAEGKILLVTGKFVTSTCLHDKSNAGDFDIAYIELNSDFISENNITPLNQNKLVIFDRKNSPHIAFIHGFPVSKNKQSKALWNTEKYQLKTYAYAGIIDINFKEWDKHTKRKDNHTCMSYRTTSENNTPTHPKGLSGCGLWVVPNILKPDNYLLDSIMIEYYEKDKVVFATKISKVINFIKKTLLCRKNEGSVDI